MSVSTTGFVLTENKDIFEILNTIENTLMELINRDVNRSIWVENACRLPIIECNTRSKFFSIRFKVSNENRILMIHFGCDCDYSEYGNSKIIWSVGYWGMAEEIILSICNAMKQFGQVFYEANDCDGEIVEIK